MATGLQVPMKGICDGGPEDVTLLKQFMLTTNYLHSKSWTQTQTQFHILFLVFLLYKLFFFWRDEAHCDAP